jgi:hypothetical protein
MSTEHAPADAPVQDPEHSSGKQSLLTRKRRPHRKVTLPASESRETAHDQLIAALTPMEIAEINTRTFEHVPDPNRPGEVMVKSDGKRSFYLIAKALREPDGKPTYPGDQYVLGAEQIGASLDQSEIDLLLAEVNDHSGISKKARDLVGKGSAGTPNLS